ncbi:hypothetical protein F4861DRAFT_536816 [Xylaria intraflava]|nr:hypothetical protein F4861DRAFT_536816 [Xylaria intraflava]
MIAATLQTSSTKFYSWRSVGTLLCGFTSGYALSMLHIYSHGDNGGQWARSLEKGHCQKYLLRPIRRATVIRQRLRDSDDEQDSDEEQDSDDEQDSGGEQDSGDMRDSDDETEGSSPNFSLYGGWI